MIRPNDGDELSPLAARRILVAEFSAESGGQMAGPGVRVEFDHLDAR